CIAFSPDGKSIASGSSLLSFTLGEIKIWDRATGKEIRTLLGRHLGPVMELAFSPDGKRLVSAGFDKSLIVWDVASGSRLHTLRGHGELVSKVAFRPDGKVIASGSF